ncbi:hypothetical protein [Bradyrhizobium sp. WSM3983]|uniref:hypothetical protein n=1 Tax=Bradyrhizobium sp. WSM3983 TaxID=1038867 RepID=UPI0012EC5E1A|nr:hypothetical protein [Bradyrhizobium sp. WSM3983]
MVNLIGEHGFYVYLVLMAVYVAFITSIRRAPLNDIRNSGSGWQETNRIVHAILIERYSRVCTHKIEARERGLAHVRYPALCGLKPDIPKGPKRADVVAKVFLGR